MVLIKGYTTVYDMYIRYDVVCLCGKSLCAFCYYAPIGWWLGVEVGVVALCLC
jgi:hypothetical protein